MPRSFRLWNELPKELRQPDDDESLSLSSHLSLTSSSSSPSSSDHHFHYTLNLALLCSSSSSSCCCCCRRRWCTDTCVKRVAVHVWIMTSSMTTRLTRTTDLVSASRRTRVRPAVTWLSSSATHGCRSAFTNRRFCCTNARLYGS